MEIYLICPVRNADRDFGGMVRELESAGHSVHYPPRDVDQSCPSGVSICTAHLSAMKDADEVHIIWDVNSKGSHFDLGMAFALGKPIHLIETLQPDTEGKSYLKLIQSLEVRHAEVNS